MGLKLTAGPVALRGLGLMTTGKQIVASGKIATQHCIINCYNFVMCILSFLFYVVDFSSEKRWLVHQVNIYG